MTERIHFVFGGPIIWRQFDSFECVWIASSVPFFEELQQWAVVVVFVIAIQHRPGRGSSRISGSTSSCGGGGGGFLDQQCAVIGGADGAKLVVFFFPLSPDELGGA
jgi:hypothetical protein